MGSIQTAPEEAPLNYRTQYAVERAAIGKFNEPACQWGGEDCKQILRDWFPELLDRARKRNGADATTLDYEVEINDASCLLDELREAFAADINRTLCNFVQAQIWSWPTDRQLMFAPREWSANITPVDTKQLEKALSEYIECPWLQHNIIDGAALNAFLFSALSSAIELYRLGAFGPTDWSYVLRPHVSPFWRIFVGGLLGWIVFPFLKWGMMPAVAALFLLEQHGIFAEITLGIWGALVLYGLVTRKRRRAEKRTLTGPQARCAQPGHIRAAG